MGKSNSKKRRNWLSLYFYKDKANNAAPDVFKDNNHSINASNLCTEIMLPTNEKWSFVCVLSSLNVLHYDKWKNTDAVETMVYFLMQ